MTSTHLPAPALSIAERRLRTLQRTGLAQKRKIAEKPPTLVFYGILVVVTMLTLLGLVMVFSSSSVTLVKDGDSAWYFFQKQMMWAFFGLMAGIGMYRMPYYIWRGLVRISLLVAFGLNVLTFVPFFGAEVNGAKAWVGWGFIRFQPSEFLKLAIVLYCADLLARRHRRVEFAQETLFPMLLLLGGASGVCLFQKDIGSATIFGGILLMMCFIAGLPKRHLLFTGGVVSFAAMVVVLGSSTARARFTAFLDLEGTKGYRGYQVYQSLLSIANGGPTGVGIGSGTGKWGYVPLSHSDFIFAIIAEELGLVGTVLVLGGFIALVYLGVQTALGARDMYGALLAGGVTAWFGVQAIVNIGGVTGSLPMTGLTLPFISYGGSSLMVSMAAAGLLLNVARNMK